MISPVRGNTLLQAALLARLLDTDHSTFNDLMAWLHAVPGYEHTTNQEVRVALRALAKRQYVRIVA